MGEQVTVTNAALEINALGGVEIRRDGRRVDDSIPDKAALLLIRLADAGAGLRRSELAGLLWSDHPEDRARANLRLVMTRLRSELGDVVDADRSSVWLTTAPEYDVAMMAAEGADGALSRYRGDFLAGVETPGAPLFDEWAQNRRTTIREGAVSSLFAEAQRAYDGGDVQRCLEVADKLLELEPWDEHVQRLAMRALAATRGEGAALARFNQFCEALDTELGIGVNSSHAGVYVTDVKEGGAIHRNGELFSKFLFILSVFYAFLMCFFLCYAIKFRIFPFSFCHAFSFGFSVSLYITLF